LIIDGVHSYNTVEVDAVHLSGRQVRVGGV
jgi:hypothetical protein